MRYMALALAEVPTYSSYSEVVMPTGRQALCVGLTGLLFFVSGATLGWYGFPTIIHSRIKNEVLLRNGTAAFERWRKLPFPLSFKVYLFNVTNPEEVNRGEKPTVQEVGPYVYDVFKEKYDVIVDEENFTVTYLQKETFIFNQKKSGNLTEDDEVTILNVPFMGFALKIKLTHPYALSMVTDVLPELFPGSENVFLTATVRELLFDGIVAINCSKEGRTLSFIAGMACSGVGAEAPTTLRMDPSDIWKFSFFHHKNVSNNEEWVVNNGLQDPHELGRIQRWKGEPNVTIWGHEECSMINGTDSTIFPPFWSKNQDIYIFNNDICRSVYVSFEKEIDVSGIPTLHYTAGEHFLEDVEKYPPNRCFCPGDPELPLEERECPPLGVMDLSNCVGAPVIMTFPHFYKANTTFLSYVDGLNPSKEKHETFLDLEPQTGVPVRGGKRAQLNMFLTRIPEFTALENVSEGLFPVVWIEEAAELPEELISKLRMLNTWQMVMNIAKWALVIGGVALICIAIYMYSFRNSNAVEECPEVASYDNMAFVPCSKQEGTFRDKFGHSTFMSIPATEHHSNGRFHGFPKSPSLYKRKEYSISHGETIGRVNLSNVFM